MTKPINEIANALESMNMDVDRTQIGQNKILAKGDVELIWCYVPSMGANYGSVKAREMTVSESHRNVENIEWLVTSGPQWERLDLDIWGLIETLDDFNETATGW